MADSPPTFTLADLHDLLNLHGTAVLTALAALVLHGVSQYHEPPAHIVLVLAIVIAPALVLAFKVVWSTTTQDAVSVVAQIYAIFIATMSLSMATYRVLFHRLCRFPGPLSCKLSMWSWPLTDWIGTRHYKIQEMHQRWGDYVRIGPREISVANPDALEVIYGSSTKVTRGPWYQAQEMTPNIYSLQTQPKIPDHNRRRRDWDPAFKITALETYQPSILRNSELLIEQIERLSTKGIVDIKECMLWFGFDVMGELGFGRSFGTLKDAKTSSIVHLVEFGARTINTMGDVPYISYIFRLLPSPLKAFETWLEQALDWRIEKADKQESVEADILAYLLGEQGKQSRLLNKKDLHQDCMLLVIAGSDTTSNALAFTLFELAKKPELVRQLREEISGLFPDDTPIDDFKKMRDEAPLINASLTESLRMWPPVPSGLQRNTLVPIVLPGGGVIPANTVLSTHCFSMHRDPRNFYDPDEFIPHRWIQDPVSSKRHNSKAFSPFGYGVTSCIGKNLAFMEMRIVLARFLHKFDFSMDPRDSIRFQNSIRDQFVSASGEMLMKVSLRGKVSA